MYSRVCNNCGQKSYSSSFNGKWECPYCREQIEDEDRNLN